VTRLDIAAVHSRLLPGEINWSVHYEPACESTQDLARTALAAGADQGWLVVTDLQRQGRGRQGHAWIAPPEQALLLSLILRPPIDVLNKLPLLVGLAVAGGIEAATGAAPDLKWPNDVLLNGRKIAGILLERPPGGAVIVGLGVNVNQEAAELPEGAGSLRVLLGGTVEREALLAAILNDLGNAYERADREGVHWIVPAWRSRSSMSGQRVKFLRQGMLMEARVDDVTEAGSLRVRTDDGRELDLLAGEVEQVRPA
jgi:BirA family transcriptional regulator, biotin operon repressor / biotin---[acetyl-CoA-carboxylase] ligase